jgi:ATP phosphoribosyltransferase regulatory subunit HisZ
VEKEVDTRIDEMTKEAEELKDKLELAHKRMWRKIEVDLDEFRGMSYNKKTDEIEIYEN